MSEHPGAGAGVPAGGGQDEDEQMLELAARLFDAARAGHASVLVPYLDAGVPVNLTSSTGDTLLMLAAYHGHAPLVELLLRRGADPDTLNDRGQSPLAGAVFKGYSEVVEVLVAAGADPDAGTPSAREAAAFFNRPDLAALLGTGTGPDQA
ncbi:Ankyrin repeat [Arthrobacter saudimassiliensis]|uniref:Ankyrin repeat n=1 Tax=Arthrobacter saudimassiliensis TaxID=1461584 RepID=A0A078MRM4_9MICC|nr:Ankyrin repeat [Arthrobacter saudimassiliensis]